MKFSDLGLSPKVLAAVEASGYTEPTPIQAQAIPEVLNRRDVMGIAQTGTGKTAAFTLPMISLSEKGRARARMPRTLILEPTRELAAQVEQNFEKYAVNHKLNVALLIGGTSMEKQMKILDRGADVLIATPGRLLDLFERGRILMNGVEILVIDEADRMLDMGFIPDIERIVKMVPFTRQTLFFSATMPPIIEKLADQFLQNPVQVMVAAAATTAKTVEQKLVKAPKKDFEKRAKLRDVIDSQDNIKNAIIFCNRKVDVATLHRSMTKRGYSVGSLHGDMDQSARMKTLAAFRDNEITHLVASDVAARGLDIPDVSHVFNYDVPIHPDDYVHRIGRCGRAGRDGWAFTFVTPADDRYIKAVMALTGDEIEYLGRAPIAKADDADEADDKPKRGRRAAPKSDDSGEAPKRARRSKRAAPAEDEAAPEAETDGEERSTKRPRRTSRRAPEQETKVEEAAPVAAKEPAERQERPKREPRRDDRAEKKPNDRNNDRNNDGNRGGGRDRSRNHDDDGPTSKGLGDHVPAFLLQPTGKS
ncbi:DEAD/DEAH box helicase [Ahrensia sp. R2A130]|uniref:DEAD/DEAH box helicase n=1 Tax=Ahrensia sp. R2A130 TaxID=744979 RepID=UPI0001E0D090|nr:DEAD/DEAH box helicase [Ahrensia sp. R2A130]EFL90271.1 probable ATP-dependent RNA helicase Exp9 [Ahrensia sp. R2A130]